MLGHIADASLGKTVVGHTFQVGNLVCEVEPLVPLIAYGIERIEQSAGLERAEAHAVALLVLLQIVGDVLRAGDARGGDGLLHHVNHAVEADDVSLCHTDGTVHVDVDAVGLVLYVMNSQLLVVQASHHELRLVIYREFSCGIGFTLQSAVDDGVEDDDLAYGVQLCTVGESVPRGVGHQGGILLVELFQVLVDGLVAGCKACVMAACRHQTGHLGVTYVAHSNPVEQVNVLGVSLMLLQIREDGVELEYVSCRGVDVLLARCDSQRHGKDCQA